VNDERFQLNISELLAPANNGVAEALSSALSGTTKIQLSEIRPVDLAELQADYKEEVAFARAPFSEGVTGEIGYLLSAIAATAWVGSMVEGDKKEDLALAEHLNEIGNLLNQVSDLWCQSISEAVNVQVRQDPVQMNLGKIEDYSELLESFFRIDYVIKTKGLDETQLTLLFSPDAVNDLQSVSQQSSSQDEERVEDRPPPAVRDDESEMNGVPEVRSADFEDFGPQTIGGDGSPQNIEILMDLELPVVIELGRTSMFIKEILELGPGSIVELNKLSGESVDLYVNDKKFAQGEVVIIDENFGIRITDLVKVEDRIHTLK